MTDQLLQIVLENDFLQRKESKWKEIKNISN